MKYYNEHGEEFSIKIEDSKWTVRFGPVWKVFKVFHVSSDERAREVFWILSRLKNCVGCKRKMLHIDSDKNLCENCNALRLSLERPREPIQQCCVCYQELFEVLDNKVQLKCSHTICKGCCSRINQPTGDFTWDLLLGIMHLSTVKCPMCRDISTVTTNGFRLISTPFNASL